MRKYWFIDWIFPIYLGVATFAQRQYFQVRPTNVTVAQGDTALLQCTVGNQAQQGNTHWTKDGGVLGFEDSLPGYPRYQIVGNHAQGEYHLEISAAEIEDDDEYECQVQPGEGDDGGLRAKAYLNVLVPPSNVSFDGTRNGAVIEAKIGSILEISCRASGAKPAAEIRWYQNGTPVPENAYQNRIVSEDEKRFATVSNLRLSSAKTDNGAVFTCDVAHPALPASRSLKAQFTLSVLYPPSLPNISGYEDGRVLFSDEFLQLRCIVENGNPPPDLVWYRNSVVVGRNSTILQGYTRNDYGFMVKAIDSEADYRCEASNSAAVTPLSSKVRLKVYFPPKKVELSGPDEATVGDRISFECKSSASHPQAKIEWMIDGQPWSEHTQRNKPAVLGTGVESVSTIDVKVIHTKPEMVVSCTSSNEHLPNTAKREVSTTKAIKVYYPPEAVKITYNDEKSFEAGDTVLLTCTATGGYPAATLEWFRNEKRITTGAASKHGADNSAISELTMTLSPHNNLEQVQCRAYNLASGSDRLTDTTVLHVQFPPNFVRISPDPPEFRAGSSAELVCDSGSGNPSPVLEWYRGDELLPSIVAHNKTGSHGGWVIRKRLFLQPAVEDDGAIFECRAISPTLSTGPVSEKVAISVQYPPIFVAPTTQASELLEGESIVINATAHSNPPVDQYTWLKEDLSSFGLQSTPPRLSINGPILELIDIRRTDAGTYMCRAKNAVGVANMTAVVTVKYAPSIKHITPDTYASVGDNVTLTCEADAYPLDSTSIEWQTADGDRLSPAHRFLEMSSRGRGILTIFGVRPEDTGEYACKADNGIGDAMNKTKLLVKQIPIFDKDLTYTRAAAEVGAAEATMSCVADGVPAVILSWHRDGIDDFGSDNTRRVVDDDKIQIVNSQIGITKYKSQLRILDIKEGDYGTYHCVAENEMGMASVDVEFGLPGVPDSPREIRILNFTHDYVTLTWKPGFDGGLKQRFRTRYAVGALAKTPDSGSVISEDAMATIQNLQPQTKHVFFVEAFNAKGASDFAISGIVETLGASNIFQESMEEEIPILIIILVCLVGVFLLVLNAALVVCFIRRHRRKKLQAAEKRKVIHSKDSPCVDGLHCAGMVEEKATTARRSSDQGASRKIQMYSDDTRANGAGTGLVGSGSPNVTGRIDSHYGNVSEDDNQLRPQSAMSDDDTSIRTVIEVDGSSQPFLNKRPDASPRLAHPHIRNAMENGSVGRDYSADSPSGSPYENRVRSNSLQRHIASTVYNTPSTSFHADATKNAYVTAQVADVVPPTLGPLRSLSRELYNYAPFSHYHPLPTATVAARYQRAPGRYSPPEPSQPSPVSTVVHTNGRTPYAEVRPILTTATHAHHHRVQSPPVAAVTNGDRNGGSPVLSTFASTPTRPDGKGDYMDMDELTGELV